jgi:hypothetical protein
MKWRIMASGTLAVALVLGAFVWAASLASAAKATSLTHARTVASAQQIPIGASVKLRATGRAPAAAVDPDCTLSYIAAANGGRNAHISSFLYRRHKIRAVKVNARIHCRRVSTGLVLRVTLWKTGLILPHKVAGPTKATLPKGNTIKNQKTWKKCKNRTTTRYYGTAFGSVVFQGVVYSNSLQTPKKVPLACGT